MALSSMLVAVFAADGYKSEGEIQAELMKERSGEFKRLPVSWQATEEEKAKAAAAWKIIREWQSPGDAYKGKLRVVYVTLEDRDALPGYKDRIDRLVNNIQMYYSDQMKENGYPPLTFAVDRDKSGKVVVHEAHVRKYMDDLNVETSAEPTREAATEVLRKAGINPDEEYMLVVVQMPDKKGPFYGKGDEKSGCCWICDAPHLDAANLDSMEKGDYVFGSLGMDNTVYIGGAAHELGNSFGLPHGSSLTSERGISLMGLGNYFYGKDLRKEGKCAMLLPEDALQLASVPVFSGKSRKLEQSEAAVFTDVQIKPVKDGVKISAKVQGVPPVYGVLAYMDPVGEDEYDAHAVSAVPDKEGNFSLEISHPDYRGILEMRLIALQADGSRVCKRATLLMSDKGINLAPLELSFIADSVKKCWMARDWAGAEKAFNEMKAQYGDDPAYARGLKIWDRAIHPLWDGPVGNDPALVADDVKELNLVDAKPGKVSSGWWMPFWDSLPSNPRGPYARFSSYMPQRFMYTHGRGNFTYELGGKWKTLDAVMGMPVGVGGSVIVSIRIDGREVHLSPTLSEGESFPVNLDVTGVDMLTIDVLNAPGRDKTGNWFVIADPVLKR